MADNKLVKPLLKSEKKLNRGSSIIYRILFLRNNNVVPVKKEQPKDEKKVQEKKFKKSTWIFLLCNIVIVGAIIAYTFLTQEVKPLTELFNENPYYRFFSIALVAMLAVYVVEGLCYSIILKRITGRFNFWLGIKTAIVGKYWDNITPFGSGGQLAQITYIRGKGHTGDVGTSVVMGRYMMFQIAFLILGLIAIIVPFDFFGAGEVIKYLALTGVIINLVLFSFTLLVSINKKACSILVVGGLKLLTKIKIIKNYRKALVKSMNFIKEYQKSIRSFAKNPLIVIAEVVLNMISLVLVASVAYFVYLIFHHEGGVSAIKIMIMSYLCTFASSIVPIPGGSGAAEISFVAMFSKLFTEGTTFWALMFWRILTYYLFVIVGFLFTIIEPFVVKRRANRVPDEKEDIVNKAVIVDNSEEAEKLDE